MANSIIKQAERIFRTTDSTSLIQRALNTLSPGDNKTCFLMTTYDANDNCNVAVVTFPLKSGDVGTSYYQNVLSQNGFALSALNGYGNIAFQNGTEPYRFSLITIGGYLKPYIVRLWRVLKGGALHGSKYHPTQEGTEIRLRNRNIGIRVCLPFDSRNERSFKGAVLSVLFRKYTDLLSFCRISNAKWRWLYVHPWSRWSSSPGRDNLSVRACDLLTGLEVA